MSITVTSNQTAKDATARAAAASSATEEKLPAAAATPAETLDTSDTSNDEELETEDAPDGEGEKKPKKLTGWKKRIDKLGKRASVAEERAIRAEAERDLLRQQALERSKPKPDSETTSTTDSKGEPDPDKYEKHADYIKDLTKWQLAEQRKEDEKKDRVEKSKSEFKTRQEHFKNSVDEAKKKFSDFDDVLEAAEDIRFPDALQFLVMESENPGELSYELAKDREALEKLSKLPIEKLERALGRFEAKLEVKAQVRAAASEEKPASRAPPPISPVGNKGTGAGKKSITDPNLTQREYEAIRNEQIKSRSSSW